MPVVARTKPELRGGARRRARREGARSASCRRWAPSTRATCRLLRAARESCDVVVMSLFVNPTQFGEGEDLDELPARRGARPRSSPRQAGRRHRLRARRRRGLSRGLRHLRRGRGASTDVLDGDPREPRRRATSAASTTVVAKLFNIVRPDVAFFGQKDAQQARGDPAHGARPRLPGRDRGRADRARAGRPGDELAQRLPDPEERERAAGAEPGARAPRAEAAADGGPTVEPALDAGRASSAAAGIEPEYLEAAYADDLAPAKSFNGRPVLVAVAARVGRARLIDNVVIGTSGPAD